jgi:hypothetical protein
MENIMIHKVENEQCLIHHHSHFSWSAIFAGAIIGVGLGFLLHLFGIAIGLSAYSASSSGAQAIAIGGVLGILIGVIVSMAAAGYVAGYLGRFKQCYCHGGIIYGFVTWSMALLLSALLVIPLTHYTSMYKYSLASSIVTKAAGSSDATPTPGEPQVVSKGADTDVTTPSDLAWGGWLMFLLFFIGAISCCVGACWGLVCRKDLVIETPPTTPIH